MLQAFFACLLLSLPPADKGGWPLFRGNPQQTGVVSGGILPDKPELLWKITVPEGLESTAAIVGETVYLGTIDGQILAVSLKDGSSIWKYHTKAVTLKASPAVKDGILVIGDGEGTIHALDAKTGEKLWTHATNSEIISSANFTDDGRVLVGSNDGNLYCFDQKTGVVKWKYGIDQPINGAPAIMEGHTFIAGCDSQLHVVKLSDGSSVRKIPLGGPSGASAAVVGSRIYVGNMERSFLCLDWKTGDAIWEFEPERSGAFYSSAAVTNDAVIVGARDRRIYAMAPADGKKLWAFQTRGRVDCSPIILGNRVYCPSGDGNLYCLDLKTGKMIWQHALGAAVAASCAYSQGRLIIGNSDGVVYCFGAK